MALLSSICFCSLAAMLWMILSLPCPHFIIRDEGPVPIVVLPAAILLDKTFMAQSVRKP